MPNNQISQQEKSDRTKHGILLERLQVTFGVDNSALAWFRSYLAGRRQHVRCGGKRSALSDVICGLPQGSVLGPILFILYIADLASIVADHGLSLHQYADSQIYGSCQSDATSSLTNTVSQCVDSISKWMRSNRLQLNANKAEVMWCSWTRKLSQLPSCSFSVAGALVCPVNSVRDLHIHSSTTTSLRLLTFSELCHAVSPHTASFVTFVDTSPMTASVPW